MGRLQSAPRPWGACYASNKTLHYIRRFQTGKIKCKDQKKRTICGFFYLIKIGCCKATLSMKDNSYIGIINYAEKLCYIMTISIFNAHTCIIENKDQDE